MHLGTCPYMVSVLSYSICTVYFKYIHFQSGKWAPHISQVELPAHDGSRGGEGLSEVSKPPADFPSAPHIYPVLVLVVGCINYYQRIRAFVWLGILIIHQIRSGLGHLMQVQGRGKTLISSTTYAKSKQTGVGSPSQLRVSAPYLGSLIIIGA